MGKRSHLKLIRGKRILQQLERYDQIAEATYAELEQNTRDFVPPSTRRQWAIDEIQVVEMELTPYQQSNVLQAHGVTKSDQTNYDTIVLFEDVAYEDEDRGDNITFLGTDGDEHHITPINLANTNVKVRCECLDFRWRFSIYNAQHNSLYGDPPGNYQKTTDRPSVNQRNVPGVCKHLIKTVMAMREAGLVTS